jgi:hypothetical protein
MSKVYEVSAMVRIDCFTCPASAVIKVSNTDQAFRQDEHFITEAVFQAGWDYQLSKIVCPKCQRVLEDGES